MVYYEILKSGMEEIFEIKKKKLLTSLNFLKIHPQIWKNGIN
jgi:hypothetical protein